MTFQTPFTYVDEAIPSLCRFKEFSPETCVRSCHLHLDYLTKCNLKTYKPGGLRNSRIT